MILKLDFLILLFIVKSEAQFHQNNYDILQEKIQIFDYNKKAVLNPDIKLLPYKDNPKLKLINGSADFLPGVFKNIIVNAAVYKFVNGKYRPFPINVTLDACDPTYYKSFGINTMMAHSNFRGCPAPKGNYYLKEYLLEQDKFPPHMPYGKYKLLGTVYFDDTLYVARGAWFGSIVAKSL